MWLCCAERWFDGELSALLYTPTDRYQILEVQTSLQFKELTDPVCTHRVPRPAVWDFSGSLNVEIG
jgi:hypothetical protein